jgi:hypothetical protein
VQTLLIELFDNFAIRQLLLNGASKLAMAAWRYQPLSLPLLDKLETSV